MLNVLQFKEHGQWKDSFHYEANEANEKLARIVSDCLETFDYEVRIIPQVETVFGAK